MEDQRTCCIFEYMYRDAGNFKTDGRLLLSGQVGEAEAVLLCCLDWGKQFVAEQVGVPSLCREHWQAVEDGPSDLDHAYHEFVRLRSATRDELALAIGSTLQELVQRMQTAAGRWDVTLSPNCDL